MLHLWDNLAFVFSGDVTRAIFPFFLFLPRTFWERPLTQFIEPRDDSTQVYEVLFVMFHNCDKGSNIPSFEVGVIEMWNQPSRNVYSSLNSKIFFDCYETAVVKFAP